MLDKIYQNNIDWLFNQFPAYHNIGLKAYKPDITNCIELTKFFDFPQTQLKFIHVAGTNGKGSTSSMFASILKESGKKVGLFTSPHIEDFRERIMVNGEMISKTDVIDFCEKVKALRLDFQPSFFEITWVMALVYFASKDCDICVVETGLGGRLDATNLIHPLFSVITNIGLEHTNILGDTLEKIAFEKAGIIKDNVPVIIGETLNETIKVFKEIAKSKKSDIFFAEENCDKLPDNFPLLGEYQKKNFKIIQTAIPLLRKEGFEIDEASLAKGLLNISSNTSFKARLQIINTSPLVILDVSHNYDGIKATLETIYTINKGHLYLLFGSSSDKDLDQIFTLFPKDASYFFTEFKNERSATIQTLEKKSAENNLQSFFFTKSQDAYSQIQSIVNKDDTVLIFGSFFLVSEFF